MNVANSIPVPSIEYTVPKKSHCCLLCMVTAFKTHVHGLTLLQGAEKKYYLFLNFSSFMTFPSTCFHLYGLTQYFRLPILVVSSQGALDEEAAIFVNIDL